MADLLAVVYNDVIVPYPTPVEGVRDRNVAVDANIAQSKIAGLEARLQQIESRLNQTLAIR